MGRISSIIVIAAAFLLVLPGMALGQAPYPPGASATCPTGTVVAGGTIVCEAEGFAPQTPVTVEVAGTNFSRDQAVTADSRGVASARIDVPADAAPGATTVTFTGTDVSGNFVRVAAAQFTIAPRPAAALPTTGTGVTNGLLAALGALVLGGLFITAARRRSRKDTVAHS